MVMKDMRWWLGVSMLLFVASAHATLIRKLNLEEMVERADRIIVATVESVTEEDMSSKNQYPTTVIEFKVSDTFKGKPQKTVKLRQLSSQKKTRLSTLISLPSFRKGESVVVFLSKESQIGMTSPVGFEQGVFRIPTKMGQKATAESTVLNALGNRPLFQRVQSTTVRRYLLQKKIDRTQQSKPITLRQLKDLVGLCTKTAAQ